MFQNVKIMLIILMSVLLVSACATTPKGDLAPKVVRQQPTETVGLKVTKNLYKGHKNRKYKNVTVFKIVFPKVFGPEMLISVKDDDLKMYFTNRRVWHGKALLPRKGTVGKSGNSMVFLQAYLMKEMTSTCQAQFFVLVDDSWKNLTGMRPIIFSTGGNFAVTVKGKKLPLKGTMIADLFPKASEIRDIGPNTKGEKKYLNWLTDPKRTVLRKKGNTYTLYPKDIPFKDISGRNPEYTGVDRLRQNGGVSIGVTTFDPTSFVVSNVVGNALAASHKPKKYFYQGTASHYKMLQKQCRSKKSLRVAKR